MFNMSGEPRLEDYVIPIWLEAANGERKNKIQGMLCSCCLNLFSPFFVSSIMILFSFYES